MVRFKIDYTYVRFLKKVYIYDAMCILRCHGLTFFLPTIIILRIINPDDNRIAVKSELNVGPQTYVYVYEIIR